MELIQKLKDTWKNKNENVELYESYVDKELSSRNLHMKDFDLAYELCCYFPFDSYLEVLSEKIKKYFSYGDAVKRAKKSVQIQKIVRPILEADPNQVMIFIEKLKDENAFKDLNISLMDRIEAALPAVEELNNISCFVKLWNILYESELNIDKMGSFGVNNFYRIFRKKVNETYLSDEVNEEDLKVQTQQLLSIVAKSSYYVEQEILNLARRLIDNVKIIQLKILTKELKNSEKGYKNTVEIIEEALLAFENIEEGKCSLLPGQIVVNPKDKSSLLAAMDKIINLVQSSEIIEAICKNNGHYNRYGKGFYEGDFSITLGNYNEDGYFQPYSDYEFSIKDFNEALIDFEEGRNRLYTYIKLLTAYLQYNEVPYFIITSNEIIHGYEFLCLLRKDPKAHYFFATYHLGVDEWRDLTEDEPYYHNEMVYECIKDCKESIHTMLYLSYSGNHYMDYAFKNNIHKFPYDKFLKDDEWMEEMHRAFAAAYIDKRNMEYSHRKTVKGKFEGVDANRVEEDFKDFFKRIFLEYAEYYFEEEYIERITDNPEKVIELYAEQEDEEVENLDEEKIEFFNILSRLYPVFCELDKRLDLQKIHDMVLKTINREIDFPRPFGPKIDMDDIPELFTENTWKLIEKMFYKKSIDRNLREEVLAVIELEDDGELLRKVKQSYIKSF